MESPSDIRRWFDAHWVGERGSKEPASVTTIVPKGGATKAAPAADEHKHP